MAGDPSYVAILIFVVASMAWWELLLANTLLIYLTMHCFYFSVEKNRFKALYWDKDGFILLYKRIEKGHLQSPRNQEEVKKLTSQELRWLLEGLSIQQPKAIKPAQTGCLS